MVFSPTCTKMEAGYRKQLGKKGRNTFLPTPLKRNYPLKTVFCPGLLVASFSIFCTYSPVVTVPYSADTSFAQYAKEEPH